MGNPFYTAEHEAFRDVMRRFVEKEIEPFAHEWDEAGESMRLVLQLAEQAQMLHPLLERLNMTVEHGARAAAPHLVPDAMHIEPFFGALFPPADFIAHFRIENLRAAAGESAQASLAQNRERLRNGKLENALRQMANLDRGESLDDQIGIERAQPVQQFDIPILFQRRVQSPHHVDLRDPSRERLLHGRDDVIDRALERMRIAFLGRESAKLTGENAEIRVIDVAIQDIGRDVSILLLPHGARQDPESVEIVGAVKMERFCIRNALAGHDLFGHPQRDARRRS